MSLLDSLAKELMRGVEMIDSLTDEIYSKMENGAGSVGSHIRHNIDFCDNFLKGLKSGKIDYCRRERDIRVEKNRQYARERILFLIRRLQNISRGELDREILVCSEIDDSNWLRSTGARELEFVYSHTVHHYALISAKLNFYGIHLSPDFGVAPSTLEYWAEQKKEAKIA